MADDAKKPKKRATILGYPISIFFIVINEFCERFSYYGMRAVLVLYFTIFLKWDDDTATSIYHVFVALCYLTPILGAIVADSWLGKFKTIIYLSIVYAAGQGVLAVSAIHDITDTDRDGTPDNMTFHVALSMVGLLLIALGTGGIKPCVAAFGGDQFEDHQEKQRGTFFSIFYLSINAGSLLSTIITPFLRGLECGIHTQQSCYPLAFGVPAILMVVALLVFIFGSGMYIKQAPKGNIMLEVCKCIWFAVKNRYRHRSSSYPKREHWMDWADEKYDKLLIAQVKMVLKVLFLYIPLPMFWALFDQQGSRWTLQATTMDGDFGFMTIQPDQMQTVNPILILALVPIVDSGVYPLIAKCKLNFTPLKRMTVGMMLAAVAFIIAAVVQLQIDEGLPKFPAGDAAQVKYINMMDSQATITVGSMPPITIQPFMSSGPTYLDLNNRPFDLTVNSAGTNTVFSGVQLEGGMRQTTILFKDGPILVNRTFEDLSAKPAQGRNAIRFVNGFSSDLNVTVADLEFPYIASFNTSEYELVRKGNAAFKIVNIDNPVQECTYTKELGFGSSFTLVIPTTFTFGANCADQINAIMDIDPNTIHMAWQIPQYFFMTCGEVVFSVTGLEFSYSQAPSNMKSVLQAGWLFTVAVGNFIVLIIAEGAQLPDQWAEYVLFASLLLFVCVVFSVMAYFYTYNDPAEIEARFAHTEDKKEERKDSLEMERKASVKSDKSEKKRGSISSSDEEPAKQDEEDKQTKI